MIPECVLQLIMNIPFTALYFASYESAKRATMKHANCEESLLIQGLAGTRSFVHASLRGNLHEQLSRNNDLGNVLRAPVR